MFVPDTLQTLTLNLASEAAKHGFSVTVKFVPLVDLRDLNFEQTKHFNNVWNKTGLEADAGK